MDNQNALPLTMDAVLAAYDLPETLLGVARYGQGHINDTYCVVCQPQEGDCIRFVLQGLSTAAFPHPKELMENMIGITSYLREKIAANGGDTKRETLSIVKTKDGKDFFTDRFGKVWRLTHFVEGTDCFQSATPELFEASARAFGRFQYMLQGYPADTLHETIVKFHDTEDRYQKFLNALNADKMGRADSVQEEVQFVLDRKADCSVALQALRDGKLPLRVTHNDNVFDNIKRVIEHAGDEYSMIVVTDHGGHDRTHGTDMEEDMMGILPDQEWEGRSLIER